MQDVLVQHRPGHEPRGERGCNGDDPGSGEDASGSKLGGGRKDAADLPRPREPALNGATTARSTGSRSPMRDLACLIASRVKRSVSWSGSGVPCMRTASTAKRWVRCERFSAYPAPSRVYCGSIDVCAPAASTPISPTPARTDNTTTAATSGWVRTLSLMTIHISFAGTPEPEGVSFGRFSQAACR